ncbi:unnamed protein product (mitochondrion) [Plasmodiophora brassicae]|uniref:Uncharacterized protein n=1 Tax=Plasmodiophora brassicae TaxID=37360 RepID=A0A3P3YGP0_PLABS|nr:unnamed protein product [Plasmodiophora brassicae]
MKTPSSRAHSAGDLRLAVPSSESSSAISFSPAGSAHAPGKGPGAADPQPISLDDMEFAKCPVPNAHRPSPSNISKLLHSTRPGRDSPGDQ